ncbi:MAG: TraR/DksA family transcriptional regulator [Fidelibacterota bacterium]
MNKEELEYFKQIILKRREELLKELNYLKESAIDNSSREAAGDNSNYSYHMADMGTDSQEREKAFFLLSRENKYLSYLNDALARIERGEYGYCVECKKPIKKERLEAVPHAKLCVPCKNKLNKSKQAAT